MFVYVRVCGCIPSPLLHDSVTGNVTFKVLLLVRINHISVINKKNCAYRIVMGL